MSTTTLQDLVRSSLRDAEAAVRAARTIADDASQVASTVLELSHEPGWVGANARQVTSVLQEVLVPLLAAAGAPDDPVGRDEYVADLVDFTQAAWRAFLSSIDELLDDRRVLPSASGGNAEPVRVCDAAFVAALSQVTLPSPVPRQDPKRTFLEKRQLLRDGDIDRFRREEWWNSALRDAVGREASRPRKASEIVVGARPVDANRFRRELDLPRLGVPEFEAFLVSATFDPARVLVHMARGRSGEAAVAASMLEELGILAYWPLVEAGPPPSPVERRDYLERLDRLLRAVRATATGAIARLLDDRRDLPGPPFTVELPVPTGRVCDEAYLGIARLVALPGVEFDEIRESFLHCSNETKDAVISRGRESGSWDGPTAAEWKHDQEMG